MSTKMCSGLLKFCLDLEVFAKLKKDLVSRHSGKPGFLQFFSINQDLNKKIISQTLLRKKRVQNLSKKY